MKSTYNKILATFALMAAGAACAGPVTSASDVALVSNGVGSYSAGISMTHTAAGDFTDVFTLTGLSGWLDLDGLLQTAGARTMDIDFYKVTIGDDAFDLSQTAAGAYAAFSEQAMLDQVSLYGPFTLTVSGHAGGSLADGTKINASYSGTINASTAVPEPGSLALVIAGLGAAAWVARRRAAKSIQAV